MYRCLLVVCALAISLKAPLSAGPILNWSVARNEHFEVYSQAGPERARAALDWFEQLRAFFQAQTTLSPEPPARLRVIGFASEREYQEYRLRPTADAYYAGYGGQNTIVLPGLSTRQMGTAAHEYVHALLHTRGGHLPPWLSEGLAEVYSTVQVNAGESLIGAEAPNRLARLRQSGVPSVERLLRTNHAEFQAARRDESSAFYAGSWALTHMLLFAPGYAEKFPAFLTAISSGEESAAAISHVWNRPIATVDRDLSAYVAKGRFIPRHVASALAPATSEDIASVPAAEAKIVTADLLLILGETPRALALYQEAGRETPRNAHISAALGAIALQRQEREQAQRYWQEAIRLGIDDAQLCFHYAALAQETGAAPEAVRAALARAILLAPEFDDARYQLALLEKNTNHEEAAIAQFQAMRHVLPARAFSYWTSLADAYLTVERRGDAKAAAQSALPFAHTPPDRAQVHRLLYLADTEMSVRVTRDASGAVRAVTTRIPRDGPKANPFVEVDDRLVKLETTLTEVRCEEITRLVVAPSGDPLVLAIPDPTRVLMQNAPPEFTCGPQDHVPVIVEYAAREPEGIVRSLSFSPPPLQPVQ